MISTTEMYLDLTTGDFSRDPRAGGIFYEMLPELADAMYRAYLESPEFEEESREDFEEELDRVLRGLYGEFLPKASFAFIEDDKILGALFVCRYKDVPTTTYLFVDPDARRRGLATDLLETACAGLKEEGETVLKAYLNLKNNEAFRLYEDFGFREKK